MSLNVVSSLLVTIYGSCEVFVSEYCNLLADRLLQMCSYDISREVVKHCVFWMSLSVVFSVMYSRIMKPVSV